jgi:hypothetical protein
MSGNICAEWNSLLELAANINGNNNKFANMTRIGHLRSHFTTEKPELFNLMQRFASSQCSDPRDKVYGLRAIARDGDTFEVDYSCRLFDLLISIVSRQNFNAFKRWVTVWTKSYNEMVFWWGAVRSLNGRNEDIFSLNALHTGWKLMQILTIRPGHISADLSNSGQDWLVFPLSEGRVDPVSYPQPEPPEGVLFYRTWIGCGDVEHAFGHTKPGKAIEFLISKCGRIINIKPFNIRHCAFSETDIGTSPVAHAWVCKRVRAVHISRYLYCILLYTVTCVDAAYYGNFLSHQNLRRDSQLFLDTAENSWAMNGELCNCDLSIAVPAHSRSPWETSTHDADCECFEKYPVRGHQPGEAPVEMN